jgi:hypothetical protein
MHIRFLCDAARVLAAARHIEPSRARRRAWYLEDPISQLENRTAEDVVQAGETSRLIALIQAIRAYERRA